MHARILETLPALEPYRAAWSAARTPTPFATLETYERWMAHQGRTTRPFVVVVLGEDDQLVALAPWILRKEGGLRRVSGISDAWYQDPVFLQPERSREAARLIVSALKRSAWRWDLLDLNVQDALSEPLLKELPALGLMHARRIDGWQTRIMRFGDDWEAFWQERSESVRRQMKRHEQRLARVPHRVYAADPSQLSFLLAEIFRRHGDRWIPTARRNWEAYYAMYQAIVDRARLQGELFLHVLEIEGTPAAFDLAIRHGEWCYGLFKVFDPAFSAYAPGNLLTKQALQRLFECGVRQVDPGGGDDRWKESYMSESLRTLQPLVASPASPLGNALVAWKGWIRPWLHDHPWLVSVVKRLREGKRQLLSRPAVPQQLPS